HVQGGVAATLHRRAACRRRQRPEQRLRVADVLLLETVAQPRKADRHNHAGQHEHEHQLDETEPLATHVSSVGQALLTHSMPERKCNYCRDIRRNRASKNTAEYCTYASFCISRF